jgi:hypothetical protein
MHPGLFPLTPDVLRRMTYLNNQLAVSPGQWMIYRQRRYTYLHDDSFNSDWLAQGLFLLVSPSVTQPDPPTYLQTASSVDIQIREHRSLVDCRDKSLSESHPPPFLRSMGLSICFSKGEFAAL